MCGSRLLYGRNTSCINWHTYFYDCAASKNGGINICNYFVGFLLILNTHQHHALFGMRSMSFLEFFANNPGIQTPDVTTSKVNYACQVIDFFHD